MPSAGRRPTSGSPRPPAVNPAVYQERAPGREKGPLGVEMSDFTPESTPPPPTSTTCTGTRPSLGSSSSIFPFPSAPKSPAVDSTGAQDSAEARRGAHHGGDIERRPTPATPSTCTGVLLYGTSGRLPSPSSPRPNPQQLYAARGEDSTPGPVFVTRQGLHARQDAGPSDVSDRHRPVATRGR